MEVEEEQKIEKTVRRILEKSNMDEVTEHKIRKQASEELELDLCKKPYKAFVKQVVQSFLEEQAQEQEEVQADGSREYDDEGNPIICKLSEKRKVTVQEFRGKTLVSIREYYKKDGKELPTSKGANSTNLEARLNGINIVVARNKLDRGTMGNLQEERSCYRESG